MQCTTIHDSSPLKDPYCRTIIPSPNTNTSTQLHHPSLILLSPTVGAKVPKAASHRDRDGGGARAFGLAFGGHHPLYLNRNATLSVGKRVSLNGFFFVVLTR